MQQIRQLPTEHTEQDPVSSKQKTDWLDLVVKTLFFCCGEVQYSQERQFFRGSMHVELDKPLAVASCLIYLP
jgi:hypothetical protein